MLAEVWVSPKPAWKKEGLGTGELMTDPKRAHRRQRANVRVSLMSKTGWFSQILNKDRRGWCEMEPNEKRKRKIKRTTWKACFIEWGTTQRSFKRELRVNEGNRGDSDRCTRVEELANHHRKDNGKWGCVQQGTQCEIEVQVNKYPPRVRAVMRNAKITVAGLIGSKVNVKGLPYKDGKARQPTYDKARKRRRLTDGLH